MDQELGVLCSAASWEIIDEAITYSRSNEGASIPQETSLRDYVQFEVKQRGYSQDKGKLILDMTEMWGNFVGEPIDRQSLRYMWLEECIEGGKRPEETKDVAKKIPNLHVD